MSFNSNFHTLKGYELTNHKDITSSMEDYLEMICRIFELQDYVRINVLAKYLNVKPSSASKMVNNLNKQGFVYFEKYGYIKPTEKGLELGKYLIYRHNVLNEFLCLINNSHDELEQVEKIEHFIDQKTVNNIYKIIHVLKNMK